MSGAAAAAGRAMCSSAPVTDGDQVTFEERGVAGIATLNRPQQLNALNLNMVELLEPRLRQWERSQQLVIVRGAGDKAFCAGGDVVALTHGADRTLAGRFFRAEYRLNHLTGTLRVPYVALQHGIVMGGGCGLSVHGRYRVCTKRSMLAMPETAIGLFPDVGGSHFLSRLRGRLGLYLALTGRRLKGADLLHAGVATHACDAAALEQLVAELAEAGAARLPDLLNAYTQRAGFTAAEFSLAPHLATIDRCFAADSVPQILVELERDGSAFAAETHALLLRMSPTSLVVTTEQLRRGRDLSLADCLRMETRLADRFHEDHDFREGVRAVLVDKDQQPRWRPASVAEVTDDTVQRYFAPLPADRELQL